MNEILIKSWYDPCQKDLDLNDSCVCISMHSTDIAKVLLPYESFMEGILVEKSGDKMIWKNLGRELVSEDQFDVWANSMDNRSSAMAFVAIISRLTESFKSGIIPEVVRTDGFNNGVINIPILSDEYKPIERFINPMMSLLKRDDVHEIVFYDYNEGIATKSVEKSSDIILDLISENKSNKNASYLDIRDYILRNFESFSIPKVY